MHTPITPGRILAIVAGTAFTVGGIVILLGEALTRPAEWTTYHALTILTVFGTIAAGHLMATASSGKRFLAALGFAMLFTVGTALVVYNSVGRQAEVADTKVLTAEATNTAIADKTAELVKARARFDDASKYADGEMTGEKCGPRCKDWRLRATEVQAHIAALESEIAALGPRKPVNAKAAEMAKVAALFGFNESQAKAALMLLEPFLWTLFFEVGSIVSLGYAFGGRPKAVNDNKPSARDSFQTDFPGPGTRMPELNTIPEPANVVSIWSRRFEAKHGRAPTVKELMQAFPDQSRTTVWRRSKAA